LFKHLNSSLDHLTSVYGSFEKFVLIKKFAQLTGLVQLVLDMPVDHFYKTIEVPQAKELARFLRLFAQL